ncbi:hypothetical protein [Candidatus Viridilinea mediisalina]|uniref:DUF4276 family protein n=1 Tax=Candidatus Viridilinea mediisalina TaxID=2024553 RepID=A0A2A6RGZ9_9CHLR|nr:hypothetical protein [Candidatus Viridilinea mediisalina]PDW02159.1 hypothetical protein CJ255_15385 [Candidatus Viridilinea mediisalina]
MNVYAFYEGSTEANVVKKVVEKVRRGVAITPPEARGKDQINHQLTSTLAPLLEEPQSTACLVLRDLDAHEDETPERIVQSLSNALRRMLSKRGFDVMPDLQPLAAYEHVFVWASAQPALRVALHIATYRWKAEFIKATIDDYILGLALEPAIAAALAESQHLLIDADRLVMKITQELPELMLQNGIQLVEAKDYVRLYAAVIKMHTAPPVFAEKTLSHASDAKIRATFAPLLAALDFLGEQ